MQRVSLGALSDVTVVLGMRQSISRRFVFTASMIVTLRDIALDAYTARLARYDEDIRSRSVFVKRRIHLLSHNELAWFH